MDIKKSLANVFAAYLCVTSGAFLYRGLSFPTFYLYYLIVTLLISVLLSLTDNVLKFLTIPKKFVSRLFVGLLLSALGVYISGFIASSVGIISTTLPAFDFGFMVTRSIDLGELGSLLLGCGIISLLYSIFHALYKNE